MEMESSFLFHFCRALDYPCASICPTIANRRLKTFAADYLDSVRKSAQIAFRALAEL
jgi:uridine phosphorylase